MLFGWEDIGLKNIKLKTTPILSVHKNWASKSPVRCATLRKGAINYLLVDLALYQMKRLLLILIEHCSCSNGISINNLNLRFTLDS